MNELIKIKDISNKYNISARTLRYYEDMGLINSVRSEDYAYRMYDGEAVIKLEQILILRKLNISIKDIGKIFNASGSEIVLDVLGKKIYDIDEEISLLHELKEIILEFITQIEKTDFDQQDDVKLLYEKAKDIKTQIVNADYNGNPSKINRFFEITEKLDKKVPDIMIVRIPKFKAVTSGRLTFEELFGGGFGSFVESCKHLFKPVMFDSPDFLCGKDGKAEWIWAVRDEVSESDTYPYKIIEFPGGLYAAAVSVDGDGESHDKVRSKTEKWLESTNFALDTERELMGNMIYADDEIKAGLGYHQMILYAPVKLIK